MAGYTAQTILKEGTAQTIGASQTNAAVSFPFKISDGDSQQIMIKVVVSATGFAVGAGITAKLRDSFNGTDFEDTDTSVAITGAGTYELIINVYNGTDKPLWPTGLVTVTTTAGSNVKVDGVYASRRL